MPGADRFPGTVAISRLVADLDVDRVARKPGPDRFVRCGPGGTRGRSAVLLVSMRSARREIWLESLSNGARVRSRTVPASWLRVAGQPSGTSRGVARWPGCWASPMNRVRVPMDRRSASTLLGFAWPDIDVS